MLVDAHIHISTSGLTLATADDMDQVVVGVIREMESSGIGGGIAAQGMSHQQLDMVTRRHGRRLKRLLNMLPDINRDLEEIDRYGDNPNIVGTKIYPNQFPGSDFLRTLKPVYDAIKSRRWIIQVHSTLPQPQNNLRTDYVAIRRRVLSLTSPPSCLRRRVHPVSV